MAALKSSYIGIFNIYREMMTETANAYSEAQAKRFMVQQIALKSGVMPWIIGKYLKTHPQSYQIHKEVICQK